MAALAYLLLPVTGLLAYFNSASASVRFHGLQAVFLGLLWPLAIYGFSALSESAGLVAWAGGAVAWLVLMVSTAVGLDLGIPIVGRYLRRAAEQDPKGR
jgi:uncharacterized membrane protein